MDLETLQAYEQYGRPRTGLYILIVFLAYNPIMYPAILIPIRKDDFPFCMKGRYQPFMKHGKSFGIFAGLDTLSGYMPETL